jgi:hypothetical protein
MSYRPEFTNRDPFPQDVGVGIQLDDEQEPLVVPEDCPECPECVPTFTDFQFVVWGAMTTGFSPPFIAGYRMEKGPPVTGETGAVVNLDWTIGGLVNIMTPPYDIQTYISLIIQPRLQDCGHRTRFVVNAGTAGWISSGPSVGSVTGARVRVTFHWLPNHSGFGPDEPVPVPGTGTIQLQIDLTDAAPGLETWTDIGPLVHINSFPSP